MNYGKEAYCKVGELESLIYAGRQKASSVSDVYDSGKSGRQTVAAYEGGNALISVTVSSEGVGKVRVYFGGAKAAEAVAGGTSCVTFAVSGSGKAEADADEGVEITSVSVSAIGAGTLSAEKTDKLVADSAAGKTYATARKDGSLRLYSLSDGVFTEVFDMGETDDFDVCVEDDALTLVTSGGGKSVVTRIADDSLACAVFAGGSAVAVDRDAHGLVLALYDGRRVTVTRLSDALGAIRSTACHGSPSVDALAFVKGGDVARLVTSDGGKNLLRTPDESGESYVKIKCAVTAEEEI